MNVALDRPPRPWRPSGNARLAIVTAVLGGLLGYAGLAARSVLVGVALSMVALGLSALMLLGKLKKITLPIAPRWPHLLVPALAVGSAILGTISGVNSRTEVIRASVVAQQNARVVSAAQSARSAEVRRDSVTIVARARSDIAQASAHLAAFQFTDAIAKSESALAAAREVVFVMPPTANREDAQSARMEAGALVAQSRALLDLKTIIDQAEAETQTPMPDVVAFSEVLQRQIRLITMRPEADRRLYPRSAETLSRLERERRRVAPDVAAELRRRSDQAALVTRCGESPGRHGLAFVAEAHLSPAAHDPDSLDVSDCIEPALDSRCWIADCSVRARNGFGALVLRRYTFRYENARITSARPR